MLDGTVGARAERSESRSLLVGYAGRHLDEFHLDLEALTRGLVVVGQSGCGKSFLLARLLEEMVMKGRDEDHFLVIDSNSDFRQGLRAATLEVFRDKWLDDLLKRSIAAEDRQNGVREAELQTRTDLEGDESCAGARVYGGSERPFNLDWSGLAANPRTLTAYLSPEDIHASKYVWFLHWALEQPAAHGLNNLPGLAKAVWDIAIKQQLSDSEPSIVEPATERAVAIDLRELALSTEWREAKEESGLPEELNGTRVSILETELLGSEAARLRVVLSCLEYLWERQVQEREEYLASRALVGDAADGDGKKKRPAWFIIVEEAHRLAPSRAANPLSEHVRELLWRTASEGRKYGIHLVLATQRPTKVAQGLLGECDNAVVMKMNSRADLEFLAQEMRILDVKLLEGALHFQGKGNALAVGEAAGAAPNVVQFMTAPRRSAEGGGDLER